MKKTTQRGVDLIKEFEGFVNHAYKAIPEEVYYTIGYGHYGADVNPNDTITEDEAEKLLYNDLITFESLVNKYDDIYKWTQEEFDALVSFAYNVGGIKQLTQNGTRNKKEIADAMLLYIHGEGGIVLEGLRRRRRAEYDLFTSSFYSDYTSDSTINDIVDGVLRNEFGVEEERKNNLFELIQHFVNERLNG